jgi:hypothetical protein
MFQIKAVDRNKTGSCEEGDEPSGPMKDTEFLDKLSDYKLLQK